MHKTVVDYGPASGLSGDHGVTASLYPFEETISRLKRAITDADLWLIHEIDPQMLLRRGGYEIRATRQLLFFHPRFMLRLLHGDPSALIEAPLKLVVMEMPTGAVIVRSSDPTDAFARYVGLGELGRELSELCDTLTAAVTQTGPGKES
ncbi:uncharacterized protein (DUF302 family) [Bradyrhizobium sp. LB1.3]